MGIISERMKKPFLEKKDKRIEIILSMLKKEGEVSLSKLSKKIGADFDEIFDLIHAYDEKGIIKVIYPAVGVPYIFYNFF
jgi:DNA-binding Lrp family transcriptional regulator